MSDKNGSFIILNQDGSTDTEINISLKGYQQQSNGIRTLCLENKSELINEYFGALNSGITPIIVNPGIPKEKVNELEKRFESNHYENSPLGHVTCSSGTTSSNGPLKAFHFELAKPLANSLAHYKSLGITTSQNILFPMPLTHSFGVVVGMLGTVALDHKLYTFNETPKNDILIDLITQKDIDLLYLTPTLARLLMKYMKRKKVVVEREIKLSIGSAHIYKEEIASLKGYFPKAVIFYTYGLSEVGPRVSTLKCENLKAIEGETLPIGEAIDGINFEIRDDILHVQSDYANSQIGSEFYNTADEAKNVNGHIFLRGRIDNTINFAGVNIYPQEIEPIIQRLTQKKSILIGLTSKLQGEVPILVIEADEEFESHFDQKVFISELSKEVPVNFHPQRIFFLREFPTTNMGKIKRKEVLTKIS